MRMPQVMSDDPCVNVRSQLRPSTYRALDAMAQSARVSLAEVLSRVADAFVAAGGESARVATSRPEPTPRVAVPAGLAADPRDEIDRRIIELNARGMSDNAISKMITLGQPATSARRRRMGLESPRPRGARRVVPDA